MAAEDVIVLSSSSSPSAEAEAEAAKKNNNPNKKKRQMQQDDHHQNGLRKEEEKNNNPNPKKPNNAASSASSSSPTPPGPTATASCSFPMSRVGRLVRNEPTNTATRTTPDAIFVINKASEMFLELFAENAFANATRETKKILSYSHLYGG